MADPLTGPQRDEMAAEVAEAHRVVSHLLSDLRRRYSAKSPAVKAAAKAEWDLFHLKQQILNMDLDTTPGRSPLPALTRGGKVIDPADL